MKKLPTARSESIVVQELGEEVLVYDLLTHKAYCLNLTASLVYRACDGNTSFDELRSKYKFTEDIIFLALDQLKEDNLIETNNSYVSPFSGMSRRDALRRVGLASMIALPFITSLMAPRAADAQSGCTAGGSPGAVGLGSNCACGLGATPNNPCTTTFGLNCKTGCTCIAGPFCTGFGCTGTCT